MSLTLENFHLLCSNYGNVNKYILFKLDATFPYLINFIEVQIGTDSKTVLSPAKFSVGIYLMGRFLPKIGNSSV